MASLKTLSQTLDRRTRFQLRCAQRSTSRLEARTLAEPEQAPIERTSRVHVARLFGDKNPGTIAKFLYDVIGYGWRLERSRKYRRARATRWPSSRGLSGCNRRRGASRGRFIRRAWRGQGVHPCTSLLIIRDYLWCSASSAVRCRCTGTTRHDCWKELVRGHGLSLLVRLRRLKLSLIFPR